MSESSGSDDSVPSLSSYPPAFVSLISTFIKRAEQAETRAHKSLVILQAKDEQVIQLKQRMEILEKIACRLEEVMVPPLDLPKSPQTCEELSGPHPRDVHNKQPSSVLLETLYKRNTETQKQESSLEFENNKFQCLIDSLERSNCQLREALATESQKRIEDHEQYVETLTTVTKAFKDLQEKHNSSNQHTVVQPCNKYNSDVLRETQQPILTAAADADNPAEIQIRPNKNDNKRKSNEITLFKENFQTKMDLAESIISVLQCRLEKQQKRNYESSRAFKSKKSEKSTRSSLSNGSLGSYHTPKSSVSLKLKRVHISSQCFLKALKKQNKKLKVKYRHVCERFTESLTLCEKLKKELLLCSNNSKNNDSKSRTKNSTQSTQTDESFEVSLFTYQQDKSQPSRSTNLIQGRLDAAAKVMAKQCKQIQDLQRQLGDNLGQVDSLRKRLARTEASVASKEVLLDTSKKQLQDAEKRNIVLSQELQQLKESGFRLRQELALKTEECSRVQKENQTCKSEFDQMRTSLDTKLQSLSTALQQKEQCNDQMTNELQNKLFSLREQFIAQVKEASDRLVTADFKIQEIYLGIETFLKLLFTLNSPDMSPSSQAQAVQVASDILQLPPIEIQTILHTSRCDLRVSRWIREVNKLVHEKVFAKNLGNLLLDAVLEAKLA